MQNPLMRPGYVNKVTIDLVLDEQNLPCEHLYVNRKNTGEAAYIYRVVL